MRNISILGSTGSVGRSTLDVVDAFPEALRVVGLAAGGNLDLLAIQVERYAPEIVSVRNPDDVAGLRARIKRRVEIVCGAEGASAVASLPGADAVIAAIVGAAGIPPVYAALKAGKRVGIANKEVLVAAGDVMTRAAAEHGGEILPVDSEHNAVHQALRCGSHAEVKRIVLTASGGPFLRRDLGTFAHITIANALAHPTWKMGNKISIDSATMMNKGLEVIEAHHLFAMPPDAIDILIHPQSIVHSMVEYVDGSFIAQLSTTDMKFPIQYALLYPERVAAPFARLDLAKIRLAGIHRRRCAAFPGRGAGVRRVPRRRLHAGGAQRRERDCRGALPGRGTSLHRNRRHCVARARPARRPRRSDRFGGRCAGLGPMGPERSARN